MKRQKAYFFITLIVSILMGIISAFVLTARSIDLNHFFSIMAMTISLVWFFYAVGFFFSTFFSRDALKMRSSNYKKPELN
jgi:putative exporter of polyketide antibiotics